MLAVCGVGAADGVAVGGANVVVVVFFGVDVISEDFFSGFCFFEGLFVEIARAADFVVAAELVL